MAQLLACETCFSTDRLVHATNMTATNEKVPQLGNSGPSGVTNSLGRAGHPTHFIGSDH